MNKKELAEIKRRFDKQKGNIPQIHGCYINEKKEVISVFDTPLYAISDGEAEKYMALFRKVLSGAQGQSLLDVVFTNEQVEKSEEHELLMQLNASCLKESDLVNTLYGKIIESLNLESNYLILLMHDTYDVRNKQKHDDSVVFPYFVCAICPVKLSKPTLSYIPPLDEFHDNEPDWVVSNPELGFMFPAFDDRTSNIYNALYYAKAPENTYPDLTDALFHADMPLSAPLQKETFHNILSDTIKEELSLEVVQAVHDVVLEKIEIAKQDKEADAPIVTALDISSALSNSGVSDEKKKEFEDKYAEEFGVGTHLQAAGLVNPKKFELSTPNVTIHVEPDFTDMVETRIIDGKKYILIRAEESVLVNGVSVNIDD